MEILLNGGQRRWNIKKQTVEWDVKWWTVVTADYRSGRPWETQNVEMEEF